MAKKTFFKKALATCLVLASVAQAALPHIASAAETSEHATAFIFSDGQISVLEGDYSGYKTDGTSLTIQESGVYTVAGNCSDGNIKIKKGTPGVTLILDGIDLASSDTAPICCNKSSEVTLIANAGTVNNLADTAFNNDDIYPENANAENAVIKCKDGSTVTIGGAGTIHITANGKNGIKSGATTEEDGEASLTVEDVTLDITASVNDALNAEALLDIKSGTLDISAADDAIHCDYTLTIGKAGSQEGPDIDISSSYEGMEGANITIYSGNIRVHATDDGINAANSDLTGYNFSLEIAGGDVYVNTESGDGIDSNGTLTFSGGRTEVFSTSSSMNAPLDSDGTFRITGGTVFAVGASGMTQVPVSGSQNYVVFGSSQTGGGPGGFPGGWSGGWPGSQPGGQQTRINISAGDTLMVTDSSNTAVYTSVAVRSADYAFYSDSSLLKNGTYTLYVNGNAAAETTVVGNGEPQPDPDPEPNPPEEDHSFSEWETLTSPTCTDAGSRQRTCTTCGYTETAEIAATGHVWESDYTVDQEAACTTDGRKSVHCQNCDAVKDSQPIPAAGHKFNSAVWEYDETTHYHTCTVCAKKLDTEAHTFTWITDQEAAENVTGLQHEACTVCGYRRNENTVPDTTEPAHTHTYETIITKATTALDGSIVTKCTGCGSITGTETIYHPTKAALSQTTCTYNGKEQKPSVTVTDSSGTVIPLSNYTVTYSGNKSVGTATAQITFTGNYSGTMQAYFTIIPKGTSFQKITAKTKGFTAAWKKQKTQTTGYELQYSTSKLFTKKTTVLKTVNKTSKQKLSISKLKAGKKYYIRIRTYKTVSGKKYYSDWSGIQKVKPKK